MFSYTAQRASTARWSFGVFMCRLLGMKPGRKVKKQCRVCYTGKNKSKTAAQYEHCDEILKEKTAHLGIHVTREDIIHSFDNAKGTNGSIAMPGISELSPLYLACVTAAIAGGSTVCSHFNDSGFWLVKSLVGMDEKPPSRPGPLWKPWLAALDSWLRWSFRSLPDGYIY